MQNIETSMPWYQRHSALKGMEMFNYFFGLMVFGSLGAVGVKERLQERNEGIAWEDSELLIPAVIIGICLLGFIHLQNKMYDTALDVDRWGG